ncbi:hypothetical protein G9A89_000739 [Geosiphon pyriformis]|nr:hypothetical protein G9A89_000739 [Geosiphon pyriformis]
MTLSKDDDMYFYNAGVRTFEFDNTEDMIRGITEFRERTRANLRERERVLEEALRLLRAHERNMEEEALKTQYMLFGIILILTLMVTILTIFVNRSYPNIVNEPRIRYYEQIISGNLISSFSKCLRFGK